MNFVTFTGWINAWSMRAGLRRLGHELVTTDPGFLVKGQVARPAAGDVLLFTEEASLQRYLGNDAFHFLPRRFPGELLDNKFAFGEYALRHGVAPLPQWASADAMPVDCYPMVLKARHSWQREVKIPRGWVCHSPVEVQRAQREMTSLGLAQELFFVQKWMSVAAADNFSVCGFWDAARPARNLVCVVQRFAGYEEGLSSSAAVTVVPDPSDLLVRTRTLLDAMAYEGPFELEFLRTGDTFHVLELNPRFWMQHGLFVASGNGLLKRYLGLDTEEDSGRGIPAAQTWVDGMWMLRNAATLRWAVLRKIFLHVRRTRGTLVICPDFGDAFACLLVALARKMASRSAAGLLPRTLPDRMP